MIITAFIKFLQRMDVEIAVLKLWLLRALMLLVAVVVSACEVARVVPNAGDVSLSQEDDFLITDDEFAPRVVNIEPFEKCSLDKGVVNDKSSCENYENVNKKTHFNKSGLRFLVEFNKPVHFDSSTQGQIGLINAKFIRSGTESFRLQPVRVIEQKNSNGGTELVYEEVTNPDTNSKYRFFTTQKYLGSIQPLRPQNSDRDEGVFAIVIAKSIVYDINPNGKKIYNFSERMEYIYDNEPPRPSLVFSIDQMNGDSNGNNRIMSSSADDLEGRTLNFSRFTVDIVWDETVNPSTNIDKQLNSSDSVTDNDSSRLFEFSCTGCQGGNPYAGGSAFGSDELNNPSSGVRFLTSNPPTNTKFTFSFSEEERVGDKLQKLATASSVLFKLNPSRFEDLAGNKNTTIISLPIAVDNDRPFIDSILTTTFGEKSVSGSRIIGIGGGIDFAVSYYREPVAIPNFDEYAMSFFVGSEKVFAKLIPSEQNLRGELRPTWNFRYQVQEDDGSNAVGANAPDTNILAVLGPQFDGAKTDGSGVIQASWDSDISLTLAASSNLAFDRVLWPVTDFKDKSFLGGTNDNGARVFSPSSIDLNKIHIDGIRPSVVMDKVDSLSKILSGPDSAIGTITSTVVRNARLAVAIPFSELVKSPWEASGINFANIASNNPLVSARLQVDYCSNAAALPNDCEVVESHSLPYSQSLSQKARTLQALGESQYTTMVFAQTISSNVSGVRSVLVKNLTYSGNFPIAELTDLAGNSFGDDVMLQNTANQGIQVNEMLSIALDGGNMAIVDINLMDASTTGAVSIPDNTAEKQYFNINNRDLYIETVLNRDLLKSPTGNDVELVISVKDSSGNEVDVTSDRVKVKVDQNGDLIQNSLVFYYRLVGDTFSDYDGVQIKRFHVVDIDKVVDNSGFQLDPTIVPSVISPVLTGGTYVDTDQPQCVTTYITDDNNLSQASSVIRFGTIQSYAPRLHFALQCNQPVVYNNFANDPSSTVTPFVPISFNNLDFVMSYTGLFQSDTTIGFSYAVRPGLPSSGTLLIGADTKKVINYHVVNNTRVGELGTDHQFFTDPAQNPLSLSGVVLDDNTYFIKRDIKDVSNQANPATDIVVDTKPFPIEIIWPSQSVDFADNYQQGTSTWLSGSSPTNNLSFVVRYGYYLNGGFVDAPITLPNQTDVSASVRDPSGVELFRAVPTLATNAELTFEALASPGTTVDGTIDSLAAQLDFGQPNLIPFQSTNVTVVNAVGLPLTDPVVVSTAIHSSLGAQPDGNPIPQNTFPDLKLTNTPTLLQSVSLVADVNGRNNYQLVGAQDSPTVFFGSVYFLAKFNKPMSVSGAEETYLNATAGGNAIAQEDLVLQDKTKLPATVQSVIAAQPGQDTILVYLFSFVKNKYVGTGIEINPLGGTDAIASKLPLGALELKDIYGNAYQAQVFTPSRYPNVKLDPRSDIVSAVFANAPYRYEDVIQYSVTTSSRINLSQIASGAKLLAQEMRLKKNESSANASPQSIYARALFAATSSELASSPTGSTTITFTYPLTGINNQFNADTTSDYGLQANGPIQICDPDGSGVKNCELFATTTLDANGNDGLPAILVFSNASTNRVQVQSALNRIVAEQPQDNNLQDSGVFGAFFQLQNNSLQALGSGDILRTGDSVIFTIPITMLHESFGSATPVPKSNSLQGTTSSDLLFTLYNGIQQRRVLRTAALYGLDADGMQYEYQIQAGDLVHLKNSASAAQDYTQPNGVVVGTGTTQALQVDTAAMFTGSGETFEGTVTDVLSNNPVWKQPLDATNRALSLVLESKEASVTVDTRPYLLSAKASTPQTVRVGATVTILLRFDQGVEARNVDVILTDGSNDVTANLVSRTSGASPEELSFEFIVPASVASGSLYVKAFNNGSGYVRKNDSVNGLTQLLANLDVPNLITIQDLTIDNTLPEIIQADLVDAQGATLASGSRYYYSVNNGNDHVRIKFTTDNPVRFIGVNTPDSLIMRANLDQYDTNLTSGYNFFLDTQSIATNPGNSFILDLDVNTIATIIEDTNGIDLLSAASLALTSGTIESAASGNNLSRSLSNVQAAIEAFDVIIDRHNPVVRNIDFSVNGQPHPSNMLINTCKTGFLCVGASAKVRATIQFNESVEFSGSTNPNDYILSFVSGNGNTVFEATPESLPSGYVTGIDVFFTTPAASTNETFNLAFDQSLIARDLVLRNSATITDQSQNPFNDTNLSRLSGNRNIDTLAMDVRSPVLDSVRFQGGEYGDGADIPLYLSFNKLVSITPSVSITSVVLGSGTTTSNVSFTLPAPPSPSALSQEHLFTFTVDKTQDSRDYDGATYPATTNLDIADTYGNTATITSLPTTNGTRTNSAVRVRPNTQVSILDVSVQSQGNPVPKVTDLQSPLYFEKDDVITFRVRYSEAVDVSGSGQPYLDLNLTSATSARAVYRSGSGTDELRFTWTVQAGEEDLDGIELINGGITVPTGVSILSVNGNFVAPTRIDTALIARDFADANGVLTKVRVDALAPPAPAAVSFVVGATADQNNILTTKLRISPPSARADDIVKYRVELFDGTNPATSTQYLVDVPSNVDFPSSVLSVYATADATGDIDLSIEKSMLQGDNCKPIYAKVYAVDTLEQESSPVFSSDAANDTQNVFAPFTRFGHTITLETLTANGNVTTDLVFDAVDGYPTVNPQDVRAQANCSQASLSYFFTISDANTQQDIVVHQPISEYANWIATNANKDRLIPFNQYTTTFIAEDESGNKGTNPHNWTSYSKNLPIHYDVDDQNSLTYSSQGVVRVSNLGNGATLQPSGGSVNLPSSWDLESLEGVVSQGGYVNTRVIYDNQAQGLYFTPSSSERAALYVDHDASTSSNYDASNDKGIFFPDDNTGKKSMTVYAVVTSPMGIGAREGQKASEPGLGHVLNNRFQPFFFFGSGKYYDAFSLMPLRGLNQGFAAGFSARDGRMRNLGSLPARSDADYEKFIEETTNRAFVMPSLGSGARDILAYVFTPSGSLGTDYLLEVYRNNELMTTANPAAHVQFEDPLTIDKLYFGGLPQSDTNVNTAVKILGENLHGGMLHEFMLYTEAHSSSALEKITTHFSRKWAVPLYHATSPLSVTISENELASQHQGNVTVDGTSLSCVNNTGNPIAFPQIDIQNTSQGFMHLLLTQQQSGKTAGPFTHMYLTNIPVSNGKATITGTSGSGAFNLSVEGVAVTSAQQVKPFTGLCNQVGENVYSVAAYISTTQLTAQQPNTTIAAFERTHGSNLESRAYARSTVDVTSPVLSANLEVAFSLRKVVGNYTGPAIRVSATDTKGTNPTGSSPTGTLPAGVDIGFDAQGNVDQDRIMQELQNNSANELLVVVWYDQSGNGRHAYRWSDSYGSAPLIVRNRENKVNVNSFGKPAIRLRQHLSFVRGFIESKPYAIFGVLERNSHDKDKNYDGDSFLGSCSNPGIRGSGMCLGLNFRTKNAITLAHWDRGGDTVMVVNAEDILGTGVLMGWVNKAKHKVTRWWESQQTKDLHSAGGTMEYLRPLGPNSGGPSYLYNRLSFGHSYYVDADSQQDVSETLIYTYQLGTTKEEMTAADRQAISDNLHQYWYID